VEEMSYCDNKIRAWHIQDLARQWSVKAAFRLLQDMASRFVLAGDQLRAETPIQEQITAVLDLIDDTLNMAVTMPQNCNPEDCAGCFWYTICEMWGFQQLIRESNDVLRDFRARQDAEDREREEQLRKGQTWNAETLAPKEQKPFYSMPQTDLILKATDAYLKKQEGKDLTFEEKTAMDQVYGQKDKRAKRFEVI